MFLLLSTINWKKKKKKKEQQQQQKKKKKKKECLCVFQTKLDIDFDKYAEYQI